MVKRAESGAGDTIKLSPDNAVAPGQRRPPVTKSEIIRAVRDRLGVRMDEAREITETVLRGIVSSVRRGERVELRGIGTFMMRISPPRWGTDFKARKRMRVPSRARVSFKISRKLRARLNPRPARHEGRDAPGG